MTSLAHGPLGRRGLLIGVLVLIAVLLASCGAPTQAPVAAEDRSAPAPEIGPYLDVTGPVPSDPAAMADATGEADAVLAFVLAGNGQCVPTWGGTRPLGEAAVGGVVDRLKSRGGTLTVASGGASGPYLETACTSAEDLADAYAQALDSVGTNRLDVDVEGDVPETMVAAALADLQRTRGARVMLTVQVEDQGAGITPEGVAVVRAARDAGVDARVNVMVMNFPPEGPWLSAMTEAIDTSRRQIGELEPDADPAAVAGRLGATVMVGRNDMGMTTTLADAEGLRDYADDQGLGFLGFWSAARDNGACPGAPQARSDCSGVEQGPYAFTRALSGFRA